MDSTRQLSNLIGDIYDAALDPVLWPAVLEKTADFVGGFSCNLSSTDTANSACDVHVDWGNDPYYVELMATKYHRIYPLAPLVMAFARQGDVMSSELLMPYDEFSKSTFFIEWAKPQDICDAVAVILEKSASKFASVSVMRSPRHGMVDEATRDRMSLLGPHYRRAVAIGKALEQRAFIADTLAATLDGLAAGIFIVADTGKLLRANAAGERMLDQGELLHYARGHLTTPDASANAALQEAITSAIGGDMPLGVRGIALPLADASTGRWVVHVLPMSVGTRRETSDAKGGAAALFVQKVSLDRPPALEAIARHYKLTPTELRVLLAVVDCGSVSEMAPLLGIAESTVRSHLHHVFAKTGTNRQSDLVKLLASFASPLA